VTTTGIEKKRRHPVEWNEPAYRFFLHMQKEFSMEGSRVRFTQVDPLSWISAASNRQIAGSAPAFVVIEISGQQRPGLLKET
jgi:hypothetical protein